MNPYEGGTRKTEPLREGALRGLHNPIARMPAVGDKAHGFPRECAQNEIKYERNGLEDGENRDSKLVNVSANPSPPRAVSSMMRL